MGTARPLVHIEAATLAGGDNNQDRYAYGDGWAFVLDGATSYSDTPPVHDGGWYAERLKNALAPRLTKHPERPTVDIVADSIREAASAHHPSQGPCPTSTIALARWNTDQVELYILGDSYACALTDDGPIILTDDRIKQFGKGLRTEYRRRLREGHGFDERHHEILKAIQHVERAHRGRDDGYWVAADVEAASRHGAISRLSTKSVNRVALLTDGLNVWTTLLQLQMRPHMRIREPLLHTARNESMDPHGQSVPRSKCADDKTILVAAFRKCLASLSD